MEAREKEMGGGDGGGEYEVGREGGEDSMAREGGGCVGGERREGVVARAKGQLPGATHERVSCTERRGCGEVEEALSGHQDRVGRSHPQNESR